jgi:hypothetical protein
MQGEPPADRRVLREYLRVVRAFHRIRKAEQAHRDGMLMWTIGLMGGGTFAALSSLLSSGVCPATAKQSVIWATSPWGAGVALAVLARLIGAHHWRRDTLLLEAQEYQVRLRLPTATDATRLLEQVSSDPTAVRQTARSQCAERVSVWLSGLSLLALLGGMATVFVTAVFC